MERWVISFNEWDGWQHYHVRMQSSSPQNDPTKYGYGKLVWSWLDGPMTGASDPDCIFNTEKESIDECTKRNENFVPNPKSKMEVLEDTLVKTLSDEIDKRILEDIFERET